MRSVLALLSAIAFAAAAPPPPTDSLTEVAAAFAAAGLTGAGGAVFSEFNPIALLSVAFPQVDGTFEFIDLGTEIAPSVAQAEPVLAIEVARTVAPPTGTEFVAFMVDPDAPSPADPTSAEIRHFFQSDLTLSTQGRPSDAFPQGFRQLVPVSVAFTPFKGPAPTAGSGFHRYTILIFEQPAGFDTSFTLNETDISNFDLQAFATATGLGAPIAGNFFMAETPA